MPVTLLNFKIYIIANTFKLDLYPLNKLRIQLLKKYPDPGPSDALPTSIAIRIVAPVVANIRDPIFFYLLILKYKV